MGREIDINVHRNTVFSLCRSSKDYGLFLECSESNKSIFKGFKITGFQQKIHQQSPFLAVCVPLCGNFYKQLASIILASSGKRRSFTVFITVQSGL